MVRPLILVRRAARAKPQRTGIQRRAAAGGVLAQTGGKLRRHIDGGMRRPPIEFPPRPLRSHQTCPVGQPQPGGVQRQQTESPAREGGGGQHVVPYTEQPSAVASASSSTTSAIAPRRRKAADCRRAPLPRAVTAAIVSVTNCSSSSSRKTGVT